MIWPDWQYPHCATSWSSQAFWTFAPTAVAPIASIVVILDSPTLSIVVMQERTPEPSRCTVQAPHSATPQPNFVPVMPSTSRSTHSSGVSASTSTERLAPFTLIVIICTCLHNRECHGALVAFTASDTDGRCSPCSLPPHGTSGRNLRCLSDR